MHRRILVTLFFIVCIPVQVLVGQVSVPQIRLAQEGEVQELVLRDGSVLYGRVVEAGDPFRFVLISGVELSVREIDVRSLELAEGHMADGEFLPQDPNRTRLFFGPTARTLPKGKGYVSVFEFLLPFVGYGATDNVLLSGGFPLLFGEGQETFPFYLSPKVRFFKGETAEAAVGVWAISADGEWAGILYGVLTNGSPKGSVSLGLGYGFVEGDLAESPAVMLGGETRVNRNWALVSENYLFPGGEGLVSLGPRFMGRRLSADLGLAIPVGGDGWFVFPLVNFVWNF